MDNVTTPPKNWLVESILVTIFCCLPFGVAGIVFASQVNSKFEAGDYAGANKAAADAKKWTKIGFFIGIAVIVLYLIFMFALGGMAAMNPEAFQ
ncbi:MAG: CD225/dispanin family protein [Bacteroidia bacterium]